MLAPLLFRLLFRLLIAFDFRAEAEAELGFASLSIYFWSDFRLFYIDMPKSEPERSGPAQCQSSNRIQLSVFPLANVRRGSLVSSHISYLGLGLGLAVVELIYQLNATLFLLSLSPGPSN